MSHKRADALTVGETVTDRDVLREARRNCMTRSAHDPRVVRNVRVGRKYARITMGNFAVVTVLRERLIETAP